MSHDEMYMIVFYSFSLNALLIGSYTQCVSFKDSFPRRNEFLHRIPIFGEVPP